MADDDVAADLLDAALETAKKGEDAPAEPKEPKDSDKDKDKKEEPRDRSRSRSRSKSRRSRSRDRFGRIKRDRSRSRDRGGGRSRDRRDKGRRSRRGRSHGRYRGRRRRTSSSRGKRRGRDRDRDREREREKERRGKKEGSSSPSRPRQRSAISPESMPKLAEPPASSPKDPPPGAEESDDKKKKKSKWDDMGDPSGLPDWLKDLKEEQGKPTPPGMDPARFKIIRMEGVQIRALIGKGGETIKEIRLRSGADIKIDHLPSDPEGNVTIVGDVEKTEGMIKEVLSTKGCPLVPKVPPPPPPDGLGGAPGMPGPGMPPPLEANENEVIVPGDIVGHLIGPSGANIKEIREKAGGQVFISILPPSTPGADQLVRVAGDHREYAKQLLLEKIEELKVQYRPMGGLAMNQPGYPGAMGMPGMAGAAPMGGTVPSIPGRSKAVGMPQPMMSPAALPVPNMPLRPAPGPQGAYPGAPSPGFVPRPGGVMAAPAGYGCYGGGPEMDSLRPSLGGCGLPAMGSTTGPNSGGYMGGCGMSGCMGAPMAPPAPPGGCGCGLGSGGMGCPAMGGMSPGGPCSMRGPPGPPMPGAPGAMPPAPSGLGCHMGPPAPAPQPTFPPLAPPCMAPAASPPSSLPLTAPRAPSPPVPAPKAEPPGQSDSQDFNAILREAAKAAEATIGMSNTPKPSTPSAGVPLL